MSNTVVSLELIVFTVSLCVSSMPLALSIASLSYHRKTWTGSYIVFQSVLLATILLGYLNIIAVAMFRTGVSTVFKYIFDVMQICTMSFVCVMLPYFMYFVLAKPWRARQRVFFYSIAVFYFGYSLFGRISGHYPLIESGPTAVFLFIYIYCLVVLAKNFKTVSDKYTRSVCLTVFITSLCLVPASIVAFVFPTVANFAYPVYLLAFSIIMISYYGVVFRTDRQMAENRPKMTVESLSKYKISEREFSVVQLIGEGLTNKEIAYKLGISVNTVNNHVANIFEKMEVKSRIDLLNLLKEGPLS